MGTPPGNRCFAPTDIRRKIVKKNRIRRILFAHDGYVRCAALPTCNRASEVADDLAYGHVTRRTELYDAPKRRNNEDRITKERAV